MIPAARRLGPRLVVTSCPPDHSRQALCCKMEAELTTFLRDTKREWFCHVDDDNYLNVPALTKTLSAYNPEQDWYFGKVSISKPLQIYDKVQKREVEFYFGTGGAGFCLSRSVAKKIGDLSWSLSEIGDRIGLPDDVTVGYLATVVLGVPLTPLPGLHSHLEALRRLGEDGGDLPIGGVAKYADGIVCDTFHFYYYHRWAYGSRCGARLASEHLD